VENVNPPTALMPMRCCSPPLTGADCCCRVKAFDKKKPATVMTVTARIDTNQRDLLFAIKFFMGGFSFSGILDSEIGKTADAERGNYFHYNLVMLNFVLRGMSTEAAMM